mmetsp:Transcript_40388/g.115121  ORF Transcript_40388/g.115121 Transcript_40388/m.115121 type:complete len:217 (-) Transcript_40388:209-859(-)
MASRCRPYCPSTCLPSSALARDKDHHHLCPRSYGPAYRQQAVASADHMLSSPTKVAAAAPAATRRNRRGETGGHDGDDGPVSPEGHHRGAHTAHCRRCGGPHHTGSSGQKEAQGRGDACGTHTRPHWTGPVGQHEDNGRTGVEKQAADTIAVAMEAAQETISFGQYALAIPTDDADETDDLRGWTLGQAPACLRHRVRPLQAHDRTRASLMRAMGG